MSLEEKIHEAYCKMFGSSSYENPEQAFELILNELQALHWMKESAPVPAPVEGDILADLKEVLVLVNQMKDKISTMWTLEEIQAIVGSMASGSFSSAVVDELKKQVKK